MPRTAGGFQPGALQVLADELGDQRAALRFLAKYLTLLPGRVERIVRGLEHRDAAGTTDALLSLKVSSAMVGAEVLQARCAYLSALPETVLLQQGTEHLPALLQAASELHESANLVQAEAARIINPRDSTGPGRVLIHGGTEPILIINHMIC